MVTQPFEARIAGSSRELHIELPMAESPLLLKVAAGERDAMERCVDRFGPLIWSAARQYLGTSHEAEDAVQEIFIQLWRDAARFDASRGSETTFVMVLTRRRLIDWRRRLSRTPEATPIEEAALLEAEPPATWELDDDAQRAASALNVLPEEQRRVIELSVRDGQTHQEISSNLALPLGTVKTLLRRGLIRLRQAVISGKTEVTS